MLVSYNRLSVAERAQAGGLLHQFRLLKFDKDK